MTTYRHATDKQVEADRLEELAGYDPPEELKERFAPGTFGFHEAFHTACVVMETFDEQVLSHPAIVRDPALYLQAQRVFDGMFDLYQTLGSVGLDEPDKNTNSPSKPQA